MSSVAEGVGDEDCVKVCVCVESVYAVHFLPMIEGCGSAAGGLWARAAHNSRGRAAAAGLSERASHESSRQRHLA